MNLDNQLDRNSEIERIQWIDILKGIGISAVVVGHIWMPSSKYIFLFHMPLFFFISGYLYKPGLRTRAYLKKKTLHLIVPYVSYLLLISLPIYLKFIIKYLGGSSDILLKNIAEFTFGLFYGGQCLTDWWGAFWFISCLYFTQLLYNLAYQAVGSRKLFFVVIFLYVLALLNARYVMSFKFPWSVNVTAMAIPFFYVGHMASCYGIHTSFKLIPLSILGLILAFVLDGIGVKGLGFNMKYGWYGIPVISFGIALSCIALLQKLAHATQFFKPWNCIATEIGRASMVIMFVHSPIQLIMKSFPILSASFVRIAASLAFSLFLYHLFQRFTITRKLCLGEFRTPRRSA